jgi:leucyl-tRNA synthetase
VLREALEVTVRLLAPFVPHLSEELWEILGHQGGVELAGWPVWEEEALAEDWKTLVIQVNGKVRGKVTVAANAAEEEVREAAIADANVAKFIEGKQIHKVIVVPGRLVNVVVS